jgi:hypothetical protein
MNLISFDARKSPRVGAVCQTFYTIKDEAYFSQGRLVFFRIFSYPSTNDNEEFRQKLNSRSCCH